MKKIFFLHLLVILSAIFMSSSLRSDDFFATKDKIIEESRFKIGFLYFTPLFLLDNVGYTSNIYTYEAKANPDWTGDFGLGLRSSAVLADRLILQAEDLPYYSFYLENKDLRSSSNRFKAAAYSYVGPFNLKAGFSRDDMSQRPHLEFSRPYRLVDREWSGEMDIGRRHRLFLTAYGRFRQIEYDEGPYFEGFSLAEQLNHRENIFGLQLNRRVFTSTMVFANYELTRFVFTSSSGRDSTAQSLSLGVDFPEIGILQGSFQIGVKQFDPANPLYRRMSRASGRGEVKLTVFERLRLNLFYELQTYFSYHSIDSFFDNQGLGGGVEIFFTSFLKGGASYQDSRLKYYSSLNLLLERSDHIRHQRYYLAVPFLGNTSLGVAYNIYHLTSDALSLDITRNFWGGFINYEF